MNEASFLVAIAVSAFNNQFGTSYKAEEFDIKSIDPNSGSYMAFEIFTKRTDDYLRLRVYCNLGSVNIIGRYRLYDEANLGTGYGDEVFVTDSVLDNEYLRYGNNIVRQSAVITTSPFDTLDILLMEDGDPLLTEDDEYIALEEAA